MSFTAEQIDDIRRTFTPVFDGSKTAVDSSSLKLAILLNDLLLKFSQLDLSPAKAGLDKKTLIEEIEKTCAKILKELAVIFKISQVFLEVSDQHALYLLDKVPTFIEKRLVPTSVDFKNSEQIQQIFDLGMESFEPGFLTPEKIEMIITYLQAIISEEKLHKFLHTSKAHRRNSKQLNNLTRSVLTLNDLFMERNRKDFNREFHKRLVAVFKDLMKCEYPYEDAESFPLVLQINAQYGIRIKYDKAILVEIKELPDTTEIITPGIFQNIFSV